jgi:polysaccharide biosynthesis protein PslH
MRVLYLTNGFPYPLTSGYLRHYHLIRELTDRHEISLLSLAGGSFRDEDAAALRPMVERVETFANRKGSPVGKVTRRLRALGGGAESPAVTAMSDKAAALHAERPFDVVVHSGKSTHPVLDRLPDVPVAADLCDATSSRLAGAIEFARPVRRPILWVDLQAMRRIEARIVRRAAHVMFASERDRLLIMGTATTPGASIVPNGVDLDFWRRTAPSLGRDRIVFTGAMHYPPNVDAALVLANQVLPLVRRRIPEASLDIVGRDPAAALLAIADRPGVRVTGYVPDVRPYLDGASVFAAPLRFGAGIQNKLLEALAMEVPVVASTLAIDGLRVAREAPPAAVADDPSLMADHIIDAIEAVRRDPSATPDGAGRAYVQASFRWETSGRRLDDILRSVVASKHTVAGSTPSDAATRP